MTINLRSHEKSPGEASLPSLLSFKFKQGLVETHLYRLPMQMEFRDYGV